jgi:hypothetical protein
MSKDLREEMYRNSSSIPNVTDQTTWDSLTTGAYCIYNNNPYNISGCPVVPTPTPTPTNGLNCSSSVVPPTTISGIVVTESSTGSVSTYGPTSTSCGITTPANSKWLGLGGAFTYTMNFSVPINNLIVFIVGTGWNSGPEQENFIFTTNTGSGIPSISTTDSCYTTIVGNEIFSGGAPIDGGGGKFLITNSVNFTSVTISGNGGYLGSLLSICANSIQPAP